MYKRILTANIDDVKMHEFVVLVNAHNRVYLLPSSDVAYLDDKYLDMRWGESHTYKRLFAVSRVYFRAFLGSLVQQVNWELAHRDTGIGYIQSDIKTWSAVLYASNYIPLILDASMIRWIPSYYDLLPVEAFAAVKSLSRFGDFWDKYRQYFNEMIPLYDSYYPRLVIREHPTPYDNIAYQSLDDIYLHLLSVVPKTVGIYHDTYWYLGRRRNLGELAVVAYR